MKFASRCNLQVDEIYKWAKWKEEVAKNDNFEKYVHNIDKFTH